MSTLYFLCALEASTNSSRRRGVYSDSVVPLDCLTSLSTVYHTRLPTASDVTVPSRDSSEIPTHRRTRSQSDMADVDNDTCNGEAKTGNDNNNNNNNKDGSILESSVKMTSEEAQLARCKSVSAALTRVSHSSILFI